jgi:hypothetical protein
MWVLIFGLLHRVNQESRQPHEAFHVILYSSGTVLIVITECGPAERRTLFFNLKNQALFIKG